MSIVDDRFILLGTTEYAHERAALEFVRQHFPNHDPYHARGLAELLEASTGRLYELDLLVIGRNVVYLVEIKSNPGRMQGDVHAWRWTPPDGRPTQEIENPYALVNKKSKIIHSLLERHMGRNIAAPWVQPLIFLSAEGLQNHLSTEGRVAVVTRDNIIHAIQNGEFPGAPPWLKDKRVNSPTAREIKRAFDRMGLRPRKSLLRIGEHVLGPVIADGVGYQDRLAHHAQLTHLQHRARVYLVPDQTSAEHKRSLRRAAEREVQLLWSVRDAHGVLRSTYYAADGPLGPTLIFEDFEGALRLDHFLLAHPDLSFEERVEIVRQVGHALAACHRRDVVHGGLSPEAVLVRRRDEKLEIRLFNFQLGRSEEASATIHRSALASQATRAYQAPELASDPSAASAVSDLFSLGALMYFIFTRQAPADSSAALLKRLDRDGNLDPTASADDLPEAVVELIKQATYLSPTERFDDCADMVELFVDALRQGKDEEVRPDSTADVLVAERGDILEERFEVKKVLGHGASARVLHVQTSDAIDGRNQFALKVSRGPEHDERLRNEGEQLRRIRHPRIVQCHEILEIHGRVCLLLTIAGTRSLQQLLAEQGSLDLDLAARYGEDLLEALKELEDKSVLHRDIKPANLGVGSRSNLAKHLTLFDFSLLSTSLAELDVGTPAYRDPFLPLRSAWDAAADRWSAALTLHEMLTGLRPQYGSAGQSPLDPKAELRIESERFDAAVRDKLTKFFERALARDPAQRFESASLMLRAWSAAFETPSAEPKTPRRRQPSAVELGVVTDEQIDQIRPETPIRALPLSARAQNALDRAGLLHAKELLSLADNRLSAIRGIGHKVSAEILELRNRWRARLDEQARAIETEPFFPEYRGDELLLDGVGLPVGVPEALADAGLRTTTALARAPGHQVHTVLERCAVDPKLVRETLGKLVQDPTAATLPSTLGAWLDVIFAPSKRDPKADERILRLFGLAEPFIGRVDLTLQEVAEAGEVTRQRLQQQLAKHIERWRGQPWRDELRTLALDIVHELGDAAPVELAAQRLASALPDDLAAPPPLRQAQYAALLRVAAELGPSDDGRQLGLRRRERDDPRGKRWQLWLLAGDELLWAQIKKLGDAADELAERQPLASSGEALRTLAPLVEGSSLALERLGQDRLLGYAASASHRAARSSRLELYPLGMTAERAIELSAQALAGASLTPEEIQARVRARYPHAQPLPSRPELDTLVEKLALTWQADEGKYTRPEVTSRTSLHGSITSLHRRHTAMPNLRSQSDASRRARDFEDSLIAVVQERKLRVLAVNSHYMGTAIRELERALETRAVELDRRLVELMEATIVESGGKPEVLWSVDAGGSEHPHWGRLLKVARTAATRLADELLPSREPLLLVQAGLLARYQLDDFLHNLLEASLSDESSAIVLLNPTHEGDRLDVINTRLPVGGLLPGQAARIPFEWLENRHRGASTAH